MMNYTNLISRFNTSLFSIWGQNINDIKRRNGDENITIDIYVFDLDFSSTKTLSVTWWIDIFVT